MIELIDIEKDYYIKGEPTKVLKNINFKINMGDFIAIMGPSGSGKTTLMNIIGLLDTPTKGRYLLEGLDVSTLNDNDMSQLRNKKIGFIFQSFYLIQYLTILENVMLPVYYSENKPSKLVKRARHLLEEFGLQTKLKNKPNQLSGGQQQRVAIARALINDPELILADEPTGQLDSETSKSILNYLCRLNNEGKTIIIVTHDNVVASYAKSIIKIIDGKII